MPKIDFQSKEVTFFKLKVLDYLEADILIAERFVLSYWIAILVELSSIRACII